MAAGHVLGGIAFAELQSILCFSNPARAVGDAVDETAVAVDQDNTVGTILRIEMIEQVGSFNLAFVTGTGTQVGNQK